MQVWISSKSIPPRDTTRRGKNPPPGTIIVYKTPSPGQNRDHPRDIKLENFTNINSDTIWIVVSTNKRFFNERDWLLKYISFVGHQNHITERIKALYSMYVNSLLRKGAWNFTKYVSNFYRVLLSFSIVRVFIVIKYSTTVNQLSTEQ